MYKLSRYRTLPVGPEGYIKQQIKLGTSAFVIFGRAIKESVFGIQQLLKKLF